MDHPAVWIPVVFIGAFWLYAIYALISGRMLAGKGINASVVDRRDSPIRFWISWAMLVGSLAFMTYVLLRHVL